MTLSPLWFAPRLATSLIGSGIDVSDKHVGADLRLHEHCRICRRCAAVDVQRNDDRAKRDVPIARDRDIDPRASAKGHVGPWPRRGERPSGERQQNPIEVQDKRFRGRVFSLYRRPILHLQIWASDEADVPEAGRLDCASEYRLAAPCQPCCSIRLTYGLVI